MIFSTLLMALPQTHCVNPEMEISLDNGQGKRAPYTIRLEHDEHIFDQLNVYYNGIQINHDLNRKKEFIVESCTILAGILTEYYLNQVGFDSYKVKTKITQSKIYQIKSEYKNKLTHHHQETVTEQLAKDMSKFLYFKRCPTQ
eukprot:NODE_498_length_6794_cov_0.318250.p7 type:complete len:143 gc:universal NODE_498_length_6794_cov_0.318250:5452-5880(+)